MVPPKEKFVVCTTWTTPTFNCRYHSMCVHISHWPYGYSFLTLCSWQWTHCNPWLLPQCCMIQGFVASNVTQAKEMNYHNWHPANQFLPLTIEVFGCFHKRVYVFLHDYANAICNVKRPESLHLSILVIFLHQKVLITLQRMQTSSILNRAIAISLTTSQLPPFYDIPPITMADLLQAVGFWHGEIWLTYYKWSVLNMERFWHLLWTNLMSYNLSFFLFLTLYTFS
jgi:hypothetical protein